MIMHIQSPSIVRTVYASIFKDIFRHIKDIDAYSARLIGAQPGGEGKPPLPFLKIEKSASIFERKVLIMSIFGLNFPFKL